MRRRSFAVRLLVLAAVAWVTASPSPSPSQSQGPCAFPVGATPASGAYQRVGSYCEGVIVTQVAGTEIELVGLTGSVAFASSASLKIAPWSSDALDVVALLSRPGQGSIVFTHQISQPFTWRPQATTRDVLHPDKLLAVARVRGLIETFVPVDVIESGASIPSRSERISFRFRSSHTVRAASIQFVGSPAVAAPVATYAAGTSIPFDIPRAQARGVARVVFQSTTGRQLAQVVTIKFDE